MVNFSESKPKATPNFAKYLSKALDTFLFTKNCSVYAFSQFFDCCDVTHFGPGVRLKTVSHPSQKRSGLSTITKTQTKRA